MSEVNALAYLAKESVTNKISFKTLALCLNKVVLTFKNVVYF
jgi:hypothetical protein